MASSTQRARPQSKEMGIMVQETFDRVISMLPQLGLHHESPKFFIIYAHENSNLGIEAHQQVVKDYIDWFKAIQFNVNSDKSPHGYGPSHDQAHKGASNDIINNQLCLLPTNWHKQSADYVLIFYSKLLAKYMKDEREFRDNSNHVRYGGKTYSEALFDVCKQPKYQPPSDLWADCVGEIREAQQYYQEKMRRPTEIFHHALTETALVRYRNSQEKNDYTIPILLGSNEHYQSWEPNLKWDPNFVTSHSTRLRNQVDPDDKHEPFFKILLEFETLEVQRGLIEVMRKCFNDTIKKLKQNMNETDQIIYWNRLEVNIHEAMRSLNRQWERMERPVTSGHIRDSLKLFSKVEAMELKRISGDKLPAHVCDIDLTVIRNVDLKQDHNKNLAATGDVDSKQDHGKEVISLPELFDKREVNGQRTQPRRIFIQGRPGIGKTTLCRRIMHEYFWNSKLADKFHIVLRIPMRKLDQFTSLDEMLIEEYFSAVPNGHKLAQELERIILNSAVPGSNSENSNSQKTTLIILDGLDEYSLPEDQRTLLETLLKQSHVIITSRSYDPNKLPIPVDLTLEAEGLSVRSIETYLENPKFISVDTAQGIRRYMKNYPAAMDLIKVPIFLDILCYSWNDLSRHAEKLGESAGATDGDGEHQLPSLATIYQSALRNLWRRDIPRLGKIDHGEPVSSDTMDKLRDITRLDRLVDFENSFLEEVAADMMESGQLEFTSDYINEAVHRIECSGTQVPLSFDRNFDRLSIIRFESRQNRRVYRFVHLTFQEFFAARRLAEDGIRRERQLKQHKYDPRFKVVWYFVAGLLSLEPEKLDSYFDMLEQEPRDLIGARHVSLVLDCLHASNRQLKQTRRTRIYKYLSTRLDLELNLGYYRTVGSDPTFPDEILYEKLASLGNRPDDVYRIVGGRKPLSEKLCNALLDIAERCVLGRGTTIFVPLEQPLPEGIIKRLFGLWNAKNGISDLKPSITPVLKMQTMLSERICLEFLNRLDSIHQCRHHDRERESNERAQIIDILRSQEVLPDSVRDRLYKYLTIHLNFAFEAFGKNSEKAALAAVEILDHQRRLPLDFLRMLTRVLPCENSELTVCIAHTLAGQAELDSDTTEKLRNLLVNTRVRYGISMAAVFATHEAFLDIVLPRLRQVLEEDSSTTEDIIDVIHAAQKLGSNLPPDFYLPIILLLLSPHGHSIDRRSNVVELLRRMSIPLNDLKVRSARRRLLLEKPGIFVRLCCDPGRPRIELRNIPRDVPSIYGILTIISFERIMKLLEKKMDPDDSVDMKPDHTESVQFSDIMELLVLLPWQDSQERLQRVQKDVLKALEWSTSYDVSSLGNILYQIENMEPATLDRLVELLKMGRRGAAVALQGRQEAVEKIMNTIRSTNTKSVADVALYALGVSGDFECHVYSKIPYGDHYGLFISHFPDQVNRQLAAMLERKDETNDEISDAICKSLITSAALPLDIVQRVDNYIEGRKQSGKWEDVKDDDGVILDAWSCLSIDVFCQHAEKFDRLTLERIIESLLRRRHPGAIWTDNGKLWYQTNNGAFKSCSLKNESIFRENFQHAQNNIKIGQNSGSIYIGLTEGEKLKLRLFNLYK